MNEETIETVRIVKIHRPCGYATINKCDFDARKHTLFVDKAEEPAKEVKPVEKAENVKAEEPKPEVKKASTKKAK